MLQMSQKFQTLDGGRTIDRRIPVLDFIEEEIFIQAIKIASKFVQKWGIGLIWAIAVHVGRLFIYIFYFEIGVWTGLC